MTEQELDAMRAGDKVAVTIDGQEYAGTVVAVNGDSVDVELEGVYPFDFEVVDRLPLAAGGTFLRRCAMGMSVSGKLVYSIAPFEVGCEPWVNEEGESGDQDDWLLANAGVELPVEPPQPKDWNDKNAPDVQAWPPYWRRKREILADLGVSLEYKGTEHWAEWHLAATCAPSCGTLDLKALVATEDDANAKLTAFCARAGLKMDAPGWRVLASYG